MRYPRDVPPDELVGRTSVVRRWEVPLRVGGRVALAIVLALSTAAGLVRQRCRTHS